MVDPAKVVVIINLEAPRNVKQSRVSSGHTRYYRNFIKAYADNCANGKIIEEICGVLFG